MKRDSFTLSLDLGNELIIDNFAGGGGTSTGLEQAFGRPVDIAINHDPEALAMHAANHPHTTHLCESVWDVDPIKVTNNRPVGLVWLSPDCFPAGTLVMTDKGYRAIETIQVGDRVLTHKLRWRAVTECSSATRPLIEIRGHGHPGILVSPEHPFYTRTQYRTWNNERRSYDHALRAPEWMPASTVQKGLYWAAPCTFPESVAPDVAGRGIDMSDELLWLAGRYLGDGWTRLTDTRAEVVITCGVHEIERLRPLLNRWPRAGGRAGANELEWHERTTATAYQFTTNHRGLVEWLREHFGHRAEAKGIPAWALGLPIAAREALLEGYLSADGHKFEDFVEAHTVSKSLAFGIKALANSLGKTVAVYCRPNSSVIQGREVNARDLFKVRWRHAVHIEHTQTYREDGIEWCPVREQSAGPVSAEVFNIGVEEDESYVVEGIIVHNCKHFSKAKGGKPVEKRIRGLAWVTLRWAAKCKPRVIMLENVEEFKTWGPLLVEADGSAKPDPAKKGKTFDSFIRQLRAHGYAVEFREMRGCDHDTPTIRKRFFLVARRDGIAIKWPEPTHGAPDSIGVRAGKLLPYRTAAECIDFSLPCPSIFERDKPLAPATLRRIAKGIMRYVVDAADPFIVGAGGPARAEVRAFLLSYYGTDQAPEIDGPLATVTSRDRFGLVTIHGQDYQIVDIGLRMLQPRELFRAQGFPDDYIIGDDPAQGLKLTKSAQVRMCGNSVCPPMAKALILANFAHEREIARVA
ncbi:C-5 cytosine-specific DNA methylase [Janthinobacterium sp. HH107]|uniref:DNA cytosine methyltransferase n=1 Tax=Janthinobacterium sp. HH107 TaxID=1537279 RepID=UPI0008756313|nr:DNA cytosine methyltransferase [Janthinobacterium sp. HH107]OEZ92169.1 C-5 cytosine-specific DNA methylase [Janthinobacterium sp. HH107]